MVTRNWKVQGLRILLLHAYAPGRHKTAASWAIHEATGDEIHMGRHVLPLTQELCDEGLIERITKDEPGHYYMTTKKGYQSIDEYNQCLNQISKNIFKLS